MTKKVDVGEEVIEMKADVDGTYKSTAIVKVNPSHHPPIIPRRMPVTMEFLDGFVMGLEALENFMVNVKKFGRGKKRYET